MGRHGREEGKALPMIKIERARAADGEWRAATLTAAWGATRVVTRGRLHDADRLPALIARIGAARAGLLTYCLEEGACEIVTLNSTLGGRGVGSALVQEVVRIARAEGCRRLWLITTNDNLPALGFYQRRGLRLVALYPDALAESRKLKPTIPLLGLGGIPLRDELELELPLD